MELIGISNERQIFYSNIHSSIDWANNLPKSNWLVFAVGEEKNVQAYSELAERCIANNVVYLCAVGSCCELIHDVFDETVVEMAIRSNRDIESPEDFENSPMTTWHHNFSEGFWFAINTTYRENGLINKVVCVDYTERGVKKHLSELIALINNGWLPSDEEVDEPIYDNE